MFGTTPQVTSIAPPRRRWCLMPLLTLCAVNVASAQSVLDDYPLDKEYQSVDADVITVSAPTDSPLIQVSSPKTPRQPVPASDGADYLKTIPGFSLIRNGGTNGDPVFRGMFGSRMRILAGGAEMLGSCPSRMDAPTSYISPESYDVMTLVKGPQTVLWGPGASAGTLRFERTPPRFEAPGVEGRASLLSGSSGRWDELLSTSLGNEQGYLQLGGNRSRAGDYQDGASRRVPSRWKKWNGDLALGLTPDENTLAELSFGRGNGEASYAGRGMDGAQFKRESLGGRFEKHHLGEVWQSLEGQVYYNYINHIMDNTTLRSPPPRPTGGCCKKRQAGGTTAFSKNLDRRSVGGRVAGAWLWPELRLESGLDMQTNTHRGKDRGQWQPDARFEDYGLFSELTWYANKRRKVVGGARLDRNRAEKLGGSADQSRTSTPPSGFARVEQQMDRLPVLLYAGLGYTERFPDYWELFSPTYGPRGSDDPFRTLKSEKTTQIDIGAHYEGERAGGRTDAWLSAYAGRVDDFILFRYGAKNSGRSQADNISARIAGAELGMSYRWNDSWKNDASLAYAWGENRDDGRPLPQIPPLEARFGLTYERPEWSSTALWRLVSAQRRVALNDGNVASKDFDSSAGFGVLSANAAYKFSKGIKLSAGIDNLLNKTYSEHLNLAGNRSFGYAANVPVNEPGRTTWARLDVLF